MKSKFLQGLIKRHPDGFGFFIPDDKEHPDVYVPYHSMTGVMTNDRVMIEVYPERGGERFRGEIVRVVTRGIRQVVGIFSQLNEKRGVIRDESKAWGQDLQIEMTDSMGAESGQMVMAEVTHYPDKGEPFVGRIREILGHVSDPQSDIKRVIFSNHIPYEWPPSVLKEAEPLKSDPDESDFKGRKDLRSLNLITIDGATAKDFDDAVYVETNQKGFRLIVAIADVSHYVQPGTNIDNEAYIRGTSVYFPNYVVPMLPENLSNGLCSLNPHVPRLCLVADMQFEFTGEMTHSEFYEAVMESKARVTYGQAQEIIDGEDVPKLNHVRDNILKCADLAKVLMAFRFKNGSLNLELPETELQIDSAGMPVDVIRSERLFSHKLIEEMMLAANVAVAKFLSDRDVPAIYRIHEPPPPQAIQTLERFLWNFGGKVRLEGGKLQKRLTRALEEFEGKPEAHVLNILTLRSMSQAKYSAHNVGHFGLGFDFYTHFTSPIRRYPDLIVHRLLKNQIMKNSRYRLMNEDDLSSAATFLSSCEQRSTKAERQLASIKKARFMEKLIGQQFRGVISSVTKFGIFVLLREYDIDGLVRLDDLGGKFEFDEENLRLVAKRSGFSFNMGDEVEITVAAADITLGQVNFVVAGEESKKRASEEASERPKFERRGDKDRRRQDRRDEGRKKRQQEDTVWGRNKKPSKSKVQVFDRKKKDQDQKRQPDREEPKSASRRPHRDDSRSKGRPYREEPKATPRHETTEQPVKKKRSLFDELMEMDVDASPRAVLKGIKASYRSRENFGGSESKSNRKNSEKRGKATDDRGGVRKARVSSRSRKG